MNKKINISIDDICPHPQSNTEVLKQCFKVIEKFNDVKFTLFVPIFYTRFCEKGYNIIDYKCFYDELLKLPYENFEFGWHGYYHGIKNISSNDEFADIEYEDAMDKLNKMKKTADLIGLNFKPIFRPPAWKLSDNGFKALKDFGIKILALSRKHNYSQQYKNFFKFIYYNVNPPFDPLFAFDQTEIVYHASLWSKNYFSDNFCDELMSFLKFNVFEFCFMENL